MDVNCVFEIRKSSEVCKRPDPLVLSNESGKGFLLSFPDNRSWTSKCVLYYGAQPVKIGHQDHLVDQSRS